MGGTPIHLWIQRDGKWMMTGGTPSHHPWIGLGFSHGNKPTSQSQHWRNGVNTHILQQERTCLFSDEPRWSQNECHMSNLPMNLADVPVCSSVSHGVCFFFCGHLKYKPKLPCRLKKLFGCGTLRAVHWSVMGGWGPPSKLLLWHPTWVILDMTFLS